MKIIQAKGQTCNQFWIYSHYFAESMISGEKIIILAPNIELRNYPALCEQKFIIYPFYWRVLLQWISYKKYLIFLNLFFANKFTTKFLCYLFKVVPGIEYIEGEMQDFTSAHWIAQKKNLGKIFKPHISIIQNIKKTFNRLRTSYDIVVGVHIRRGDYLNWQGGKFYYDNNQYLEMMLKVSRLFNLQKVGFLICSNENINISDFSNLKSFKLDNGSAALDLYALSLCNYIIGPPSSFSAWASSYGNVPLYFIRSINNDLSLSDFSNESFLWPPYSSKE